MPDLQDAIALLEKGDARQASILLETMAEEMPGYATARVLLARAYEGLGEWSGALAAWREALHIVPNSPVIRRGLERAARKAASRAPVDELPSISVSTPTAGDVEVSDPLIEGDPVEENAAAAEDHTTPAAAEDVIAPGEEGAVPAGEEGAVPAGEEGTVTAAEEDSAPPVEDDLAPAAAEDEDLDRLIAELESARILPRPDFDEMPETELEDDIEDVVSVTLARIYASQGQYGEAARVYELLAVQQPESETEFKEKAAEMRSRASDE